MEAREDGFEDRDLWGVSGKVDWISPAGRLTSITAYRSVDFNFLTDFLGVPITPTTIGSIDEISEDSSQLTQELRLADSALDSRLDWVVGLYYIREETERDDLLQQDFDALTGGVAFGLSGQVLYPQKNTTDGYSVFGEVTYHATDRLHVTAGARQIWAANACTCRAST